MEAFLFALTLVNFAWIVAAICYMAARNGHFQPIVYCHYDRPEESVCREGLDFNGETSIHQLVVQPSDKKAA